MFRHLDSNARLRISAAVLNITAPPIPPSPSKDEFVDLHYFLTKLCWGDQTSGCDISTYVTIVRTGPTVSVAVGA